MSEKSKELIKNIIQSEYKIHHAMARMIAESMIEVIDKLYKSHCEKHGSEL